MILLRFGKYGLLPLPTEMLDGMNDWAKTCPLVTDDTAKKCYTYDSAGRSLKDLDEECWGGPSGTMYKDMKDMKGATGMQWSNKTTHMRLNGLRYAQAHGCSGDEARYHFITFGISAAQKKK